MEEKKSILNSEGLTAMLQNRRSFAAQQYFHNSQVVFHGGKMVGHIFTREQYQSFCEKPGIRNSVRLWFFFNERGLAFGASGHKAIPVDFLDEILDIAAGIK